MEEGETLDLIFGAKKGMKKSLSDDVWLQISHQTVSSGCLTPNSTLDDGS